SESQERMLVVARPDRELDVERVFERWELHGVRIGTVTAQPILEIVSESETVASLDPRHVADGAPEYDVTTWAKAPTGSASGLAADVSSGGAHVSPPVQSDDQHEGKRVPVVETTGPFLDLGSRAGRSSADAGALHKIGLELLDLLASPAVASRRVLYRTYDQMVGTDTVVGPGGDAGVMRIKGRKDGIAVAIDTQPRVAAIDPFVGAAAAVAEATRNVVCAGATPLAITDCLNLGNPERPTGAWQLERTVAGIKAACEALGVPVVSGNVSLYNATRGADIWPTAMIGVVGHLTDVAAHIPVTSGRPGDAVLLAGNAAVSVGTSAYGAQIGVHEGPVSVDLALEARLQRFVLDAHRRGLVRAAHDRAEGGLGVALAELALRDGVGMRVTLPAVRGVDKRVALFGEAPSGVVLVADPADVEALRACAAEHDVPIWTLGVMGGDLLEVAPVLGTPLASLRQAYERGLSRSLGRES
ncbi:MAG TPA: AIR synthase-related protein, partial [Candidatus Limnocylindria bacterium]|nr:AIR synthase-related protein [Candidatus Limnocylindria bacterium]